MKDSQLIVCWLSALALGVSTGCAVSFVPAADEGEARPLGASQQAIVGGQRDAQTSGVVGLAIDVDGTHAQGHCSGTLLAPNLVLTARHCVELTDSEDDARVRCESTSFSRAIPTRRLLVSPAAKRPEEVTDASYVRVREVRALGDRNSVCGSDVALMILEGEGIRGGAVPIAPRLERSPDEAEIFAAVGFGLTNPDDPHSHGTRQRAGGGAVRCAGEPCVELSGGAVLASEWASVNAPICSGDSGGPALDSSGRVIGVASRGDQDCQIGVYGDVAAWAPFIVDTARLAADLGGYEAPGWASGGPPSEPAQVQDSETGPSQGGCSLLPRQPRSGASAALALSGMLLALGARRRRARAPQTVRMPAAGRGGA